MRLTGDWLTDLFIRIRDQGKERAQRIVSWKTYQEAKTAFDEGATRYEIDLVLSGWSWALVKSRRNVVDKLDVL